MSFLRRVLLLSGLFLVGSPSPPALAEPVSGPKIGAERNAARPESIDAGWLERRWAQSDLDRLAEAAEARIRERGALPPGAGFDALAPDYLPARTPVDPWGRPYRLVSGEPMAVVSAGPDRSFGTGDDLVRSIPESGREAGPRPAASADAPGPAPRLATDVLVTHERMRTLVEALESFRSLRGHYPVGNASGSLGEALVPEHLPAERFSAEDGWGRSWRYRSNDVGSSYTLVSAGSDGDFEALVPLRSGPVRGSERDLVVVDGSFARWPAGVASPGVAPDREPRPVSSARLPAPAEPRPDATPSLRRARSPTEPGKEATTLERMRRIAEALEAFRAREGRFPEMDDAARLVRLLELSTEPDDAWGQPFAYLSLAAGSRCVLASRGEDGRLGHSLEDYLRGSEPRGDLVFVNARER